MESISPLETTYFSVRTPSRDGTVSSIASQIYSQDYTVVPVTDGYGQPGDINETAISMAKSDVSGESLQPRSRFRRFQDFRDVVIKFWLWEAAACIFGLLCLASIVGILRYEDGKLLDQWELSVPPTALVSFIGTLGKASLVLVLSQILSQLKWLHFRRARSLRHVRTFDGASRGLLGAMLVLWDSRKLLSSIAACLMILAIFIDPFVQLVFTFLCRLIGDQSQQAIFDHIHDWNGDLMPTRNYWDTLPSHKIITSINEGLASTSIIPTAVCPSGNCTWSGSIKTLGICGSCSDVTPDVKISCVISSNETTKGQCPEVSNDDIPICDSLLGTKPGAEWNSVTTILTCSYTFNNGDVMQAYKYVSNTSVSNNFPFLSRSRTIWNSTDHKFQEGSGQNYTGKTPSLHTRIELDGQLLVPRPVFHYESFLSPVPIVYYNPLSNISIVQLSAINTTETITDTYDPMKMPAARSWNCEIYWCEKSFEAMQITGNAPPAYTISTKRLWFFNDGAYYYGFFPSDFFQRFS